MEKYILNHLTLIGIYLILTLSLNLINGFSGLFSLGHQGFWAIGAYSSAAFTVYLHQAAPSIPPLVLFAASIFAGIFFAGLFGMIVGVPCLRLRGDYLAIATLGFAEIIVIIFFNIDRLGGAVGFPGQAASWPESFIYRYGTSQQIFFLALVYIMVILTIIFIRNLIRSSHGRAIISIREDELASELSGVNTNKYKVLVFIIGAALAGLAGALFAPYVNFFSPKSFRFDEGVKILLMVVLGGMGSLSGTVIATVLIYSIEEGLKFIKTPLWDGTTISDWWLVIYSVALITLMITRPEGLMGRKEINRTRPYLWQGNWG